MEQEQKMIAIEHENAELKRKLNLMQESLANIIINESKNNEMIYKIRALEFHNSALIYRNQSLQDDKEKLYRQIDYFKAESERLTHNYLERLNLLKELQTFNVQRYAESKSNSFELPIIDTRIQEEQNSNETINILFKFSILVFVFYIAWIFVYPEVSI